MPQVDNVSEGFYKKDKLIHEPMTFISDMALSAFALYWGFKISEVFWRDFQLVHENLRWSFYSLAIAAFFGGLIHSFGPYLSQFYKELIWKVILVLIGITAFYFLLATSAAVLSYKPYLIFRWLPFAVTFVYIFFIWLQPQFSYAVKFYLGVILMVLLMMIYAYLQTKNPSAVNITIGILIMLLGGFLWKKGFRLHRNFNHNDLYHLIQIVALWFLYRGGVMLKDYH